MRFTGRSVVITGSSRNIGLATARRFASEGAKVVLNAATSADELERARAGMADEGYDVRAVLCDVGSPEGSQQLVDAAVDAFGRLDVLVINHSVRPWKSFVEMTADEWHETMDVNLHSTFYLCKSAVPHLIAAGNASIISMGGAASSVASARRAHAFAALSGRVAMLKTLSYELAPQGVRVNFVAPGIIDTVRVHPEWYPGSPPEGVQWSPSMLKQIPIGRPGTVDELAAAVVFLASDDASYIIGATVPVGGGWGT